jgi:hypothetical protein
MPRLSNYRSTKTNDYKFLDKTIHEMYTVGGIDIFVHKYLGPKVVGDSSSREGHEGGDATRPTYDESNPLFIEDLLFLENRDRAYDDSIYTMRGVYNVQDIDFDLSQFGLFLNGDTLFITFHYNDMIDNLGRKLMNGDVIEIPNLKDYHPLDTSGPKALPKYYVIQDASFAAEGFSQTWMPHLWRVKATPLTASQEYDDILNKPMDADNPGAGTLEDFLSTKNKNLEINDAIVQQAEVEVPKSGYDNTAFYVTATVAGQPANPADVTADGVSVPGVTPKVDGYLVGYLTGNNVPPNGLPVTPGVSFPANPTVGNYALRLDFFPNRLFRYDGARWVKVEDNVRTELTPGSQNKTQQSSFANNAEVIATSDRGNIPSRQSLSDVLKPTKDN